MSFAIGLSLGLTKLYLLEHCNHPCSCQVKLPFVRKKLLKLCLFSTDLKAGIAINLSQVPLTTFSFFKARSLLKQVWEFWVKALRIVWVEVVFSPKSTLKREKTVPSRSIAYTKYCIYRYNWKSFFLLCDDHISKNTEISDYLLCPNLKGALLEFWGSPIDYSTPCNPIEAWRCLAITKNWRVDTNKVDCKLGYLILVQNQDHE
jgi:hypothetical protein